MECSGYRVVKALSVALAAGNHRSHSEPELKPPAPMVLGVHTPGRVVTAGILCHRQSTLARHVSSVSPFFSCESMIHRLEVYRVATHNPTGRRVDDNDLPEEQRSGLPVHRTRY